MPPVIFSTGSKKFYDFPPVSYRLCFLFLSLAKIIKFSWIFKEFD
jgi:hypothetical protein